MAIIPDRTDILGNLCAQTMIHCNKLRNGSTGQTTQEENVDSKKSIDT